METSEQRAPRSYSEDAVMGDAIEEAGRPGQNRTLRAGRHEALGALSPSGSVQTPGTPDYFQSNKLAMAPAQPPAEPQEPHGLAAHTEDDFAKFRHQYQDHPPLDPTAPSPPLPSTPPEALWPSFSTPSAPKKEPLHPSEAPWSHGDGAYSRARRRLEFDDP